MNGRGLVYQIAFNSIKQGLDPKRVSNINMSHTFNIEPKKSTILKYICPELF